MKETYWGYWLIVLGLFVIIIMLLIQNITSSNTEDDYSIKQITESSLEDAVDYAYYREYGELKIDKEKFIEVFLRRFADSITGAKEYDVVFTAIYEAPPKVSVEITSKTGDYSVANDQELTSFDITSRVDGILELNS